MYRGGARAEHFPLPPPLYLDADPPSSIGPKSGSGEKVRRKLDLVELLLCSDEPGCVCLFVLS